MALEFDDKYCPKKRLISELEKNSEELEKLLINIIKNSESKSLRDNANGSINSLKELIAVIDKCDIYDLRNIALDALR